MALRPAILAVLGTLACSGDPVYEQPPVSAHVCPAPVDGGPFTVPLGARSRGCDAPSTRTGVLDLGDEGAGVLGLLVVPPDAGATPLPVVFVFHPAFGSPEAMRTSSSIEAAADGGAIFVYPAANAGTWDIGARNEDFAGVERVLARVADHYCVDGRHVSAAGFSAGAVFTMFLACNAAPAIRAISTVAGTVTRFPQSCCRGPVSAILLHGLDDDAIPFKDGQFSASFFAGLDGCSQATVPDDASCLAYPTCAGGRAVDFCAFGGSHEVPASWGAETWRFLGRLP